MTTDPYALVPLPTGERCLVHNEQYAFICGGPHVWAFTTIGWELLGPNEESQGAPKDPGDATPPTIL